LTRSYVAPYRTGTVLRLDNRARAALANRLGATAFVAIHADASLARARARHERLLVARQLAAAGEGRSRATRPARPWRSAFHPRDLAVTSEARVPAVLVEVGFISNPVQERLLATRRFNAARPRRSSPRSGQTYGR